MAWPLFVIIRRASQPEMVISPLIMKWSKPRHSSFSWIKLLPSDSDRLGCCQLPSVPTVHCPHRVRVQIIPRHKMCDTLLGQQEWAGLGLAGLGWAGLGCSTTQCNLLTLHKIVHHGLGWAGRVKAFPPPIQCTA